MMRMVWVLIDYNNDDNDDGDNNNKIGDGGDVFFSIFLYGGKAAFNDIFNNCKVLLY